MLSINQQGYLQRAVSSESIVLHWSRPADNARTVVINIISDIICAGCGQKIGDDTL